jgi:hypothetical protein
VAYPLLTVVVLDRIIDYMIGKLLLVCTLLLVSLASGQARVIETDRPVDITGTIAVERTGNPNAIKGTLFLTSGDTVALNTRRWPVKRVPIFFGDPERDPHYKATRAAADTGKTVTLHGAFQWNHHFDQLYFEMD